MKEIDSTAVLEECLEQSESHPVLIFKHSTRCPVSSGAAQEVKNYEAQNQGGAPPIYQVLVVEQRPLSSAIAHQLGVQHESPQVILVKDRRPLWSTSHGAITGRALNEAVSSFMDNA